MPSTPKPSQKGRKAPGARPQGRKGQATSSNRGRKTLRTRSKHKTTTAHGERGIAFRLSHEHVRLIEQKVQTLNKTLGKDARTPSDVLRDLLVTHMLIDNPRVDGILFMGGYGARKSKGYWIVTNRSGKELAAYKAFEGANAWYVADRAGTNIAMATGVNAAATMKTMSEEQAMRAARDIAFLRAEWLAQENTGSVEPDESIPRKDKTKAFRLPLDERTALQRLAKQNDTTLSQVLRSFLTTHLLQHKGRLREVTIGSHRIYPCPEGWAIRNGETVLRTVPTLKEAFVFEWAQPSRAA